MSRHAERGGRIRGHGRLQVRRRPDWPRPALPRVQSPAKRSRTREGRSVGPEGVPDRKYDVSQLTVDELERTRRDLEVSLALITPGAYPGAP
jgi:hypothetical protein